MWLAETHRNTELLFSYTWEDTESPARKSKKEAQGVKRRRGQSPVNSKTQVTQDQQKPVTRQQKPVNRKTQDPQQPESRGQSPAIKRQEVHIDSGAQAQTMFEILMQQQQLMQQEQQRMQQAQQQRQDEQHKQLIDALARIHTQPAPQPLVVCFFQR